MSVSQFLLLSALPVLALVGTVMRGDSSADGQKVVVVDSTVQPGHQYAGRVDTGISDVGISALNQSAAPTAVSTIEQVSHDEPVTAPTRTAKIEPVTDSIRTARR